MSRKVCVCGHTQESHGDHCRFRAPGQANKGAPVKYCKCKGFEELHHDPPLKAREWKPSPPPAVDQCPICKREIGRNADAVRIKTPGAVMRRHRKCAA